jgi:general secretion pathway protein G
VIALLEWLEKHYKAAVGGLVIVLLLLAAAFASSRSAASKDIAALNEAKASLEEIIANHGRELDDARGRVAGLEKSGEASKSKMAELTKTNKQLEERIASLSEALASADKKIVSLRDSVDIRRKAMANMREDIAALKGEAREFLEAKASLEETIANRERELEEARGRLEELEKTSSPEVEDALPSSSKAFGTVTLKLSDLKPFGTIASELKKVVSTISDLAKNENIDDILSGLTAYEDFFGAVRDVAVLFEIDKRRPELYVSFLADSAKLGAFIARDSSVYNIEPWYEKGVGYYTLRPAGDDAGREVWFYAATRPAGTSSLVFMTTEEDSISLMTNAYDGVSPRFEMERHTSGENFFQVKLKDGLTYRDIAQSMWQFPALANLWNSTPDKVYWSVIEESWTQEGDDISVETYSDMLERNPEILPPRPENALKREIYGDGSLAYYVSVDFGMLLNMILPGATSLTPGIVALVDRYTPIPFISKEDFRDLLRGGRLSLVCVEKEGRVSTAYAALETNVPSAAGALYLLANLGFAAIPGVRADLTGWDSAMSAVIPLPLEDLLPAPSLVIAERRGAFLIGLGNAEDFGKTLDVSAEYGDYIGTENIGEVLVSPKLFDVAISYINDFAGSEKSNLSERDMEIKDLLTDSIAGIRDSFVIAGGGFRPSGRGYIKLTLPEGKEPIKSLFSDALVPWLEFAVEERSVSADETEASQIINDLRTLKSAALLYYGDNLEWPTQEDVQELDKYTDSPIVSGDRYERVIIGGEYNDDGGGERVNIGVKLRPGDTFDTPGIRQELADMAENAGLLENADSLDNYSGSSPEVYMNMR